MACPFARMPGPKGLPIIGTVLDYGARGKYSFEKLHESKLAKYKLFGKIYKEHLAPGVTLVQVFDPEIIGAVLRADGQTPLRRTLPIMEVAEKRDKLKCGLGSMNGEKWNRLRTVLQKPMMHPQAATAYLGPQNSVADDFIASLPQHLDANKELNDLSAHLLNYAIEAMGTVCFNSRLGCFNLSSNVIEGEGKLRPEQKVIKATSALFEALQQTTFSFPWFLLYRTAHYQQFVNSKLLCDSFARRRILDAAERKIKDADPNLPNLLHALSSNNKEELDIEDAVGLVIDLFISGIDSTANALAFLLYNVASNPEKQQLLYDEIVKQTTLGKPITAEMFEQMPYMKACVKESFRLNFPVEGGTTRFFLHDTVFGGYQIPKGISVCFNNQTMCLLEDYFDEPTKFVPERWLKGGGNQYRTPPPFVMLPFGYGRRMCIGRRFAEQEIYLALIKIIQANRLEYLHEKIGMISRMFTAPDRPIKLKLVSRHAR